MKCIECGSSNLSVKDTRDSDDFSVRRRRECVSCGKRFTTVENVLINEIFVIKRNGKKIYFDIEKIKNGILRSFNKLEIDDMKLSKLVNEIESEIREKYKSSIKSSEIGDIILKKLSKINDVAYIRFASVYYKFEDVNEFVKFINEIKSDRIEE